MLSVLEHPLAAHYLTALRDRTTTPSGFRDAAARLGRLLVVEATRDLPLERAEVETPLATTVGKRLAQPVVLVAVLRAGLGLLDAALDLLPDARVGYVGLQRDERTATAEQYYVNLPRVDDARVVILEPMLATGGSLDRVTQVVADHGARDIVALTVVCAPAGIERLRRGHPNLRVVTAALDESLDEHFFIRPGLGDMGDRLFGTLEGLPSDD